MDFPAPVATQIKPPDPSQGLSTYSSILGLKQQQQTLQTGAYQQQQEQLKAAQQQGVQDFFKSWDPSEHVSPDGTPDMDSVFQSPEFKRAGNAKPAIMQAMLDMKGKQYDNIQKLSSLNKDLVSQLTNGIGSLAKDDDVVNDKVDPKTGVNAGRAKVNEFINNFGKLSPDAARVAGIYAPVVQHAPDGKLSHGVEVMQLQGQSASEQQAQQNPQSVVADVGPGFQYGTTQRATGTPTFNGPYLPKDLGPEARAASITLGNGQQAILNRATGRYELAQPASGGQSAQSSPDVSGSAHPGSRPPQGPQQIGRGPNGRVLTAADTAPPANAPTADQEAYRAAAATARDHVSKIREQDDGYGSNMAVASEIRRLSQSTTTGPGTTGWNQFAGTLGTRVGVDISDYQKLGAFLDRQSADLRKQMGLPGTNAGQETAAAISGNTEYQRGAIQAKNNYNESLTQGLHDYRQGLDRVEAYTGNANPREVQRYRAGWTANFDPKGYEYKLAKQRGDTETANSILKDLNPQQAKAMVQKLRNLDRLARGEAPQ